MSNITPKTPSFVFGYWRPWKENSNLFDSYLNYVKDTKLVKYGADTVGKYINQASKEQVQVINQLGKAIGRGMNVLSNQMSDINENLMFLNRTLDIQIEQQKLSNLLLQNIVELLRIPDSEKERQHSIELGIKFFVNASKDEDLFIDALEELHKAESLMKQDYFVLHRIGCIYLYVEKCINPEKALEYFLRAGKYASVESDSSAVRLANVLTKKFNTVNSDLNNSEKQIGLLASDSYEKAAFAAYVLGRFSDAVSYQAKVLKFNNTAQIRFGLAKYLVRSGEINEGVKSLSKCIDEDPIYAVATFKEIDLINEPQILILISEKNQIIDGNINKLIDKFKDINSKQAIDIINELKELLNRSYEIKVVNFKLYEKKVKNINNIIADSVLEIDSFIKLIKKTIYRNLDVNDINGIIDELQKAKDLPFEKMQEIFNGIKERIKAASEFEKQVLHTESEIDSFIAVIKKAIFLSLDAKSIRALIDELKKAKGLPLEKMKEVLERIRIQVDENKLQIGSKYGGGIVFFVNDIGNHGLVCFENDFGKAIWGGDYTNIETDKSGVMNNSGLTNTKKIAEHASWIFKESIFLGLHKSPVVTAAKLCLESSQNDYRDWYLPTIAELKILYTNLHIKGIGNFQDAEYWSSSAAYALSFKSGKASKSGTANSNYVRAIRAF